MLKSSNNSLLLFEKIVNCINNTSEKQITFAEYMAMCLYDEQYGYYNSRAIAIGTEGDFFTSSSISQDFGELLAIQIEQFWQILDQPIHFTIVEMGAGEGELAKIILDYLATHNQDFYKHLQYLIIEKSSSLKQKQQQLLFPDQHPIEWKEWHEISSESIIGCFISNELIDSLPVHRIVKKQNKLQEIYVTTNHGQLLEKYGDLSTQKINEYLTINNVDFDSNIYIDNYQTEVNLSALDILEKIAKVLKQGYVLTIDYGYDSIKYYHPQRYEGTLKCYYQHRHHNNPYVNIGLQDITCHVNFTAIEKIGTNFGLEKIDFIEQALFLMALGLGDRLNNLSDGRILLSELWQRRSQLHELINPQGLGGFGVLLQGKNLSAIHKQTSLKGFVKPD